MMFPSFPTIALHTVLGSPQNSQEKKKKKGKKKRQRKKKKKGIKPPVKEHKAHLCQKTLVSDF